MSEREDYTEPGPVPAWERRAFRRRMYSSAIIALSILAAVIAFLAFGVRVREGINPTGQTLHRARNLAEACGNYRQYYKAFRPTSPISWYSETASGLSTNLQSAA